MNPSNAPPTTPAWLPAFLLTALAYALVGRLALLLAIPPGYASPLYPGAGIALAALLLYGWRLAPAVALGSLIVNLAFAATQGLDATTVGVALLLSIGAALQALAGAALIRRFVRQPLTLSEPRDIGLFFLLGAFVACLVGASIASATLGLTGAVTPDNLGFTWITWWIGDSMGTLIATPIVLTVFGQPRAEWAHRRWNVGLTLTLATLLVAALVMLVSRWNEERMSSHFEREATNASSMLSSQLLEPLRALEAMHSVFIASGDVTREEMRRASEAWLATPGRLQALGFGQRVKRADETAFVAGVRERGLSEYRVRRFASGPAETTLPALSTLGEADMMPILYIEPEADNARALGIDSLSAPAARGAIDQTTRTGRAAASAAFVLTQSAQSDPRAGVVIYQAIYTGQPVTPAERAAALRGVVFVTLDMDRTLHATMQQLPAHLRVCVVDTDPSAQRRRLYGAEGCEAKRGARLHVRTLPFAGRQIDVRVSSEFAALSTASGLDAWLFSVVGLMAAAVLGALLLTVTGRTRRIEVAVAERTSALEQQVRERELAEAALRDSEQRFRNVFNVLPLGLVYIDLRGNIRQANPRFCEMVGYSFEELQAIDSRDLTHPDDRTGDSEPSAALIRGDLPSYTHQKRYLTKAGGIIWVRTIVSALRDENGRARFVVSLAEDITEHLRLTEADRAREAAEASNRAKSDFLSRMSHELRTPLNAMLGFAQLLELDQRHPIADVQRPWVAQIQQAGWHLLDMINDVLDLSRIESGTVRLAAEPLELPLILAGTLPLVEGTSQKRRLIITQDLAPDARLVRGDTTRVKQILTNLLSNAVKYNVDDGRIHISSARIPGGGGTAGGGDKVEIAVTDTGLGMTESQLDELFEPFNRLGRERTQLEGTGIGLVISQRLATLMGGSLKVRSISGEGSSFILTLPAVADHEMPALAGDPRATPVRDYHRRVVHYVEDNETNVEVMRGIVAQRPQVRMDVSTTGLDGLAAIRAQRPDLVLLDMHLPDISGLELLHHLKGDPMTSGIPVVSVSADALEAQIDAAMNAGVHRYLTKPVSVVELLAVLDELLEGAETRFG